VLEPGQSEAGRQRLLQTLLGQIQIRDNENEFVHAALYSPEEGFPGNYNGGMKFTLEGSSNINVIRSYSADEIRIGERSIHSSCIVTAGTLIDSWPPATLDDLQLNHLDVIFELRPELVVLGTGARQRFAPPGIRAAFATRGIGIEAMDLGAACRTFNILVQEARRVAGVLFLK
jgi:uncharacterized protein